MQSTWNHQSQGAGREGPKGRDGWKSEESGEKSQKISWMVGCNALGTHTPSCTQFGLKHKHDKQMMNQSQPSSQLVCLADLTPSMQLVSSVLALANAVGYGALQLSTNMQQCLLAQHQPLLLTGCMNANKGSTQIMRPSKVTTECHSVFAERWIERTLASVFSFSSIPALLVIALLLFGVTS